MSQMSHILSQVGHKLWRFFYGSECFECRRFKIYLEPLACLLKDKSLYGRHSPGRHVDGNIRGFKMYAVKLKFIMLELL